MNCYFLEDNISISEYDCMPPTITGSRLSDEIFSIRHFSSISPVVIIPKRYLNIVYAKDHKMDDVSKKFTNGKLSIFNNGKISRLEGQWHDRFKEAPRRLKHVVISSEYCDNIQDPSITPMVEVASISFYSFASLCNRINGAKLGNIKWKCDFNVYDKCDYTHSKFGSKTNPHRYDYGLHAWWCNTEFVPMTKTLQINKSDLPELDLDNLAYHDISHDKCTNTLWYSGGSFWIEFFRFNPIRAHSCTIKTMNEHMARLKGDFEHQVGRTAAAAGLNNLSSDHQLLLHEVIGGSYSIIVAEISLNSVLQDSLCNCLRAVINDSN